MWFKYALLFGCVSFKTAHATLVNTNFNTKCIAIADTLKLENVNVNFATVVPAGANLTLTQAYNLSTCNRPSQVVYDDLCRITMYVSTSNRSGITLEAWLPVNWTGRFLSTGNGGNSGCIQYEDMAYAASMGFAVVGGNNGHNGTSGIAFLHNYDVVEDFSWRGLHTSAVVGKEVTKAFYEQDYQKSYYFGCSTGGRQGLQSAQDFPDDFDGILAGAPAIATNSLISWSGHFYDIFGSNISASFVPASMWEVYRKEVLKQCDGLDGATDGIIEDPDLCYPRPEALQCAPGQTSKCLTNERVVAVREAYSPYYGPNGTVIYPRLPPGTEAEAIDYLFSGELSPYLTEWFRYAILQDPDWDPTTFTIQDAAYAIRLNPAGLQSYNGDLSEFRKGGGKILAYHGQQDDIVPGGISPQYYSHVSNTMSLPSADLDSFFRLFRIGGMGHCSGGPGAWQIGQTTLGAAGNPKDSQHNVLMRLVDWVENGEGRAPNTVTGVKYVNDTVSLGVDFVRNHCKYPLRNTCNDPGNYKSPKSWKCVI